jgi:hypothetical protein
MKKFALIITGVLCISVYSFSQFEESQLTGEGFEKVTAHLGADFTMQYQVLNHHADSSLIPLGSGFNLPTANLNVGADLAKGIRVNLTTYLSSRHHPEAWVKGGYLLIDELPFIQSKAVDKVMDYLTLKVGDMEIDYGDAHYRRSDNGNTIRNYFVGNYVMDAFTTAIAAELMFRSKGFLAMGALSSGSLKPALTGYNASMGDYSEYNTTDELAFYWKLGYDKKIFDDLRFRLTLSGYHCAKHHFGSLYYGDRTGSRYYLVMNRITNNASDVDITNNHTSGNWGPGLTNKDNSFMMNLFGKFKGFEVFGTYEYLKGTDLAAAEVEYSQYAVEGLYRFGKKEQFYGGLRYNYVQNNDDQSINRLQIGAGWYILKSLLIKLEYVDQNYSEFIANYGPDAGFDGVVMEAAVSF